MILTGSALLAVEESSGTPFLIRSKHGRNDETPSSRIRVLVVDDQRLIADSLSEILEISGFEAKAAYDARQALEVMEQFHPQWVISDVVMPHVNGVELAIAVRTLYPMAKILLFSGQAGISEILQDAEEEGTSLNS